MEMNRLSSLKFRESHPRLTGHLFPPSTPDELVIPCRPHFYGYCQVLEVPRGTLVEHSLDTINASVRRVNAAVDLILIQKKQEFEKDYQANNIMAIKLLGGLGLVTTMVLYFTVLYDLPDVREYYLFFAMALILATVLLSIVVLIKGLMMKRVPPNYDRMIAKAVQKCLARENAGVYKPRGWQLSVSEEGKCLKLGRAGLPPIQE